MFCGAAKALQLSTCRSRDSANLLFLDKRLVGNPGACAMIAILGSHQFHEPLPF